MAQPRHQGIEFLGRARLPSVLDEPFTKCGVERLVLGSRNQARLLNQVFIGAQSDILHTILVYTIFV